MRYVWLTAAIVLEVLATSSLKTCDGFRRLWSSLVVVGGYGTAFYCLSQTLKALPIGMVYATWSGVGMVLIAIVGRLLYKQSLDGAALLGMGLVLLGVIVMNVFSRSAVH